jgi:hypothetical protein
LDLTGMSKKDLNIVLLQSDIFWEDIAKNLAHFSGLEQKYLPEREI